MADGGRWAGHLLVDEQYSTPQEHREGDTADDIVHLHTPSHDTASTHPLAQYIRPQRRLSKSSGMDAAKKCGRQLGQLNKGWSETKAE